jgi:alpha-ribazole phosphatase
MPLSELINSNDNRKVDETTVEAVSTRLLLIRHGEPSLTNCLLGRTDPELTKKGLSQLTSTCQQLPKFDFVVSSPLKRCITFAEKMVLETKHRLMIEPSWQECDFGDWDGVSYQELVEHSGDDYARFLVDPSSAVPPNGESLFDFSMRVERALYQLLKDHRGKTILVITHGGVIRSLVGWCLGLKLPKQVKTPFQNIKVDYASLTEMTVFHGDEIFPQLVQLNRGSSGNLT